MAGWHTQKKMLIKEVCIHHKKDGFLWLCASKGMDLGPNFVPVRAGFCKFCATEGKGFAVPS